MRNIEEFLYPTQDKLFKKLAGMYVGKGTVVRKGSFILVPGQAPVMLLAHLDTVHSDPVKTICRSDKGNILMSPEGIGGDDRCGVYALVTAYERSAVKPWLLFTCDEEVGGIGAEAFCKEHGGGKLPKGLDDLKMLIEVDRKGRSDAVYYDCTNTDFEDYITSKGFKTDFGSFSDISFVAPELDVAAVNLSSGYYNAHTQHEYINIKQLNATIRKVVGIIADTVDPDFPKYEYVESYSRCGGWYGYDYWGKAYSSVPTYIQPQYDALLDFYPPDELESIREEYGDWAIVNLAKAEFGDDYEGMFGDEVLEAL